MDLISLNVVMFEGRSSEGVPVNSDYLGADIWVLFEDLFVLTQRRLSTLFCGRQRRLVTHDFFGIHMSLRT